MTRESAGPNGTVSPNPEGLRWARTDQLSAVAFAHLAILGFVLILIEGLGAEPHTPGLFIAGEIAIILVCGWPWINTERGRELLVKLRLRPGGRRNDREATVERIAGFLLFVAFGLQLASLIPLLDRTGGPIFSPFAPMAIAIAAFTPFLTNYIKTVVIVVLLTAGYYILLVGVLDNLETRWSHLAVTLSILLLSSGLQVADLTGRNGVDPPSTAG